MATKNVGSCNREKGHHAERFYANLFKQLGYEHCITARLGGRIFDNAGIDIINIPFNIQLKAGKQTKMSPGKVLLQMYSQINSLFPEDHEVRKYPLYVIHRPNSFSKGYENDIVYMTLKQFQTLIETYPLKYITLKRRNLRMSTDFGEIVSIKFSDMFNAKVFNKKI